MEVKVEKPRRCKYIKESFHVLQEVRIKNKQTLSCAPLLAYFIVTVIFVMDSPLLFFFYFIFFFFYICSFYVMRGGYSQIWGGGLASQSRAKGKKGLDFQVKQIVNKQTKKPNIHTNATHTFSRVSSHKKSGRLQIPLNTRGTCSHVFV